MNYYNEFDPKAAAWLRELIKEGHIPDGWVDERSILDVKPHELTPYIQHHFFAGIGGWPLALRLAGWPDDRRVRTGSCPCQPFSQAGQQRGTADERHLFPVFRDVITFGDPTVIFGEQVASKLGREWVAGVRSDLEGLGYSVAAADLCAAGVGAPHIRQRLYWVADPADVGRIGRRAGEKGDGGASARIELERLRVAGGLAHSNGRDSSAEREQCSGKHGLQPEGYGPLRLGNSDHKRPQERRLRFDQQSCSKGRETPERPLGLPGIHDDWSRYDVLPCTDGKARRVESGTFPLAHGVSGRVGLLRGYGNAIVPQVAAQFIRAFLEVKQSQSK